MDWKMFILLYVVFFVGVIAGAIILRWAVNKVDKERVDSQ